MQPLKRQHVSAKHSHNPLPHNGRVGRDRSAGEGGIDEDAGEVADALDGGPHTEAVARASGNDVCGVMAAMGALPASTSSRSSASPRTRRCKT